MKSEDILQAVNSVTKKWTKHRQKEERQHRGRRQVFNSSRVNFTDCASDILPSAYAHASGDGKYSLPQRNFFYAAREDFRRATGREITFNHFKTIMRQYMNRNGVAWRVTADPRGNLQIPNTFGDCIIPCGTIQIGEYLGELDCFDNGIDIKMPLQWPSKAPDERYQAILYIEKEGFDPMLREAEIASKYDLAILSCKGQSVAAARRLVDNVCAVNQGVPLFVVHDFDKAGFEIARCLTSISDAQDEKDSAPYFFQNEIDVIDFGLRLKDALKYDLQSEKVNFKGHLPEGLTNAEKEFLWSDRRIELNAFTCDQFIEWLESKLKKHLPNRLMPSDEVLDEAYRHAYTVARINRAVQEIKSSIDDEADERSMPHRLRAKLKKEMKDSGDPWDAALYKLVVEEIKE